ncbi:MAG TPA: tRNA preQ1(34) S-adenosylmethionine ribosyltransferase-isomerase QueA [Candidatus Acidoferrum sp.]|nr:tRNA preQ1(34) S-adenosylmethionine ribosyltransferase-isomerase QueA [Candidatus Acidoferrum sp.]
MKKSDFYYDLPEELIAQTPLERRDASRLLTLDKATGEVGHAVFSELPDLLRPGDILVRNDSRVIPARIFGVRASGPAAVEFLLLRDRGEGVWECMVRPGKKARAGQSFSFGGVLEGEVLETIEGGLRLVRFSKSGLDLMNTLEEIGRMPLPPYIHEELRENERYQTVYAVKPGSAAAPTAGLHFTPELLDRISAMGIGVVSVTLHVGIGTFRPVKEDEVEAHHMHSEWCSVSPQTAAAVNAVRAAGGRVICVGTTSCRTVESMTEGGRLISGTRDTDIFIYPPYEFKMTDALITNFHLPESTLLMLVSALSSRERILAAYKEAVKERYRFFSFGDAMFIY